MNWINLIVYTILGILGILFWWAIIKKFMEVL